MIITDDLSLSLSLSLYTYIGIHSNVYFIRLFCLPLNHFSFLHIYKIDYSGIKPDGNLYSLRAIKKALKNKVGFTPRVTWNKDLKNEGIFQLYQIFFCVDKQAKFIECPVVKEDLNCAEMIKFPIY